MDTENSEQREQQTVGAAAFMDVMHGVGDANQRHMLKFYGLLCGAAAAHGQRIKQRRGFVDLHVNEEVALLSWAYAVENKWTADDLLYRIGLPNAFPTDLKPSKRFVEAWEFSKSGDAMRIYLERLNEITMRQQIPKAVLLDEEQKAMLVSSGDRLVAGMVARGIKEEHAFMMVGAFVADVAWMLNGVMQELGNAKAGLDMLEAVQKRRAEEQRAQHAEA